MECKVMMAMAGRAIGAALIGLALTTTAAHGADKAAQKAAQGMDSEESQPARSHKKAKRAPVPLSQIVDVNSASKQQLKALPGIGDAEADKIIANRPYPSKIETVTRGAIPHGIYTQIKDRLVAKQPGTPEPSKSAAKQKPKKASDKASPATK